MQDDSCSWIAALALEEGQHVVGRPFTMVSFPEQSSYLTDSVLVLSYCVFKICLQSIRHFNYSSAKTEACWLSGILSRFTYPSFRALLLGQWPVWPAVRLSFHSHIPAPSSCWALGLTEWWRGREWVLGPVLALFFCWVNTLGVLSSKLSLHSE